MKGIVKHSDFKVYVERDMLLDAVRIAVIIPRISVMETPKIVWDNSESPKDYIQTNIKEYEPMKVGFYFSEDLLLQAYDPIKIVAEVFMYGDWEHPALEKEVVVRELVKILSIDQMKNAPYAVNPTKFDGLDITGTGGKVTTGSTLYRALPALRERVKNPVTGVVDRLEAVIINLNDRQKWTRERVAEWLETLDLDLTFKVDEDAEKS